VTPRPAANRPFAAEEKAILDITNLRAQYDDLRRELYDLKGALLRNAGAYEKCLECRLELALELLKHEDKRIEGQGLQWTESNDSNRFHKVLEWIAELLNNENVTLDCGDAASRHFQEVGIDIGVSLRRLANMELAEKYFDSVKGFVKRIASKNHESADNRRLRQPLARWEFERLRLKVDDLCNPEPNRLRGDAGELLDDHDDGGMNRKQIATRLWAEVDTARRDLYANPPPTERELLIGLAEYSTLKARLLSYVDEHEQAMQALAEAENGISEDDPSSLFLVALTRRIRAQLRINHADWEFARSYNGPQTRENRDSSNDKARVQLELAKVDLDDCERVLRRTRRHLGAWSRLYDSQAQHAIEELLLIARQVDNGREWSDRTEFESRVHSIVLRGLEAIRRGLDGVSLPKAATDESTTVPNRQRFIALWLQLLVLTYALSAAEICTKEPRSTGHSCWEHFQRSGPSQFKPRWAALNQSAGLTRIFGAVASSDAVSFESLCRITHDGIAAKVCELACFRRVLISVMVDVVKNAKDVTKQSLPPKSAASEKVDEPRVAELV
jgi:hypothetical protein